MENILREVFDVIEERKKNLPEGSYVASLFKLGEEKMLRKIQEETLEVILASREGKKEDIIYESADLIFHLMVLLSYHNIDISDIYRELEKRRK